MHIYFISMNNLSKKIHIYFISMNKCVCVIFPTTHSFRFFEGGGKQNQTFKNLQITYYIFGTFYRQIRHTLKENLAKK